jgi:hypothetical protein
MEADFALRYIYVLNYPSVNSRACGISTLAPGLRPEWRRFLSFRSGIMYLSYMFIGDFHAADEMTIVSSWIRFRHLSHMKFVAMAFSFVKRFYFTSFFH